MKFSGVGQPGTMLMPSSGNSDLSIRLTDRTEVVLLAKTRLGFRVTGAYWERRSHKAPRRQSGLAMAGESGNRAKGEDCAPKPG